jgi:hypothetical protein
LTTRSCIAAVVLLVASPFAQGASAGVPAALLKDLASALQLLEMPCGEVLSATRLADNDHLASCKNGLRYRVFVNAEGRVVAQKQ